MVQKKATVFVAQMELASRQTGTDGLTHFSVRRSYGVRKVMWPPRHRRTWFETDCSCWSRWLLFVHAVWGTQGRHGTVALSSGIKPACACSLLSSQLAEYLLWDPAGGWQGPAEGNIWPIVVTKCPHHPQSHQEKHYLPRCGTWISSRRPFFRGELWTTWMSQSLPRVLHYVVPSSPLEICARTPFSTLI